MSMSHMRNATVLSIEGHHHRQLWNTVSVPYPTSFHPKSDEDLATWQNFVRSHRRKYRISFGGVGHGMGAKIRGQLADICVRARPYCRLFHCGKRMCMRPHNVIWHYLGADFCFQPPGDTPTRKGMFDCMIAGGIPVLFHELTAFRYFWHLPKDHDLYSVFHSREDFWKDNGTALMRQLRDIPPEKVHQMRENVIQLIPQLIYAMPGGKQGKFRDAFDISVESAVQKVSKMNMKDHPRLKMVDWTKS